MASVDGRRLAPGHRLNRRRTQLVRDGHRVRRRRLDLIGDPTPPKAGKKRGLEVIDTDVSSDHGAFSLHQEGGPFGNVSYKLHKKTLANGDVCKGASGQVPD
jgi:hypothetical protein